MTRLFSFLGSLLLGAAACSHAPPSAPPPPAEGELVYRGAVFGSSSAPLFNYERRVEDRGDVLASTHVSHTRAGELAVAHAAVHTPAYALRRFETHSEQTGVAGTLTVLDDGRVRITRRHGGRTRTRIERPGDPVVVGPTLFGFALRHWDALVAGAEVPLRFAVVERLRTYRFVLRLQEHTPTATVFSMTASSPIVRAGVPTMRLTFATATREIVRYEGRVPPEVEHRGRLRPLDARVEYTLLADYR